MNTGTAGVIPLTVTCTYRTCVGVYLAQHLSVKYIYSMLVTNKQNACTSYYR